MAAPERTGATRATLLPRLLAASAALVLLLVGASGAEAARPLVTGFSEPQYKVAGKRKFLLDRTVRAKAGVVRIDVWWRTITDGKPLQARNPADPAYDFGNIDGAVKAARARGLAPVLSIRRAPRFAEGPNRPRRARRGTWKPKPDALRNFAIAVARRYRGGFPDPSGGRLPRVRYYQAWNEWTSEHWLSPAWQNGKLFSPHHYRRMIRAFYAGVKSVRSSNKVVSGGTNPFGDGRGGSRIRPVKALRALFCLRGRKKLRAAKGCRKPAKLDGLDHHAINTSGGPNRGAIHPDDATSGDFRKVRKVLRKAEKVGHVRPGGRRPLWVTESWFESKPPDRKRGVPLARQARWVQLNLYVLWKQGARYVFNLQVRDTKIDRSRPAHSLQGGLLFASNKRKPAFRAFRFPFVGDRGSRRRVKIWGKAPKSGTLRIQKKRRGRGWRTLKRTGVREGRTFKTRVRLRKRGRTQKLRGRIGKTKSAVWRQR